MTQRSARVHRHREWRSLQHASRVGVTAAMSSIGLDHAIRADVRCVYRPPGDRWERHAKAGIADVELDGRLRQVVLQRRRTAFTMCSTVVRPCPRTTLHLSVGTRGIGRKNRSTGGRSERELRSGSRRYIPSEAGAHKLAAHGVRRQAAHHDSGDRVRQRDRRGQRSPAGLVVRAVHDAGLSAEAMTEIMRSLYGTLPPISQLARA